MHTVNDNEQIGTEVGEMKKIYITFFTLLAIGIGSGIYYFTGYQQSKMAFPEDLVLNTHKGEPYAFENLSPKIRLIEFMYTQCPDVCPNTTFQMKQLRDQLTEDGVFGDKVEFLTVSFDPKKDTPEVLGHYAETFEMDKTNGWYLLHGPKEDIKKLADNFKFLFRDPGTGEFIHTSATYLLDENNKVIDIFGMGEKDFKQKEVYKEIMKQI